MPPLVLDGTNGVSGVDGTASNPAIEGTDSNTGIFYPAADTVAIGTGGTERLRVDSSGNVGIATTSPDGGLDVEKQNSYFGDTTNGGRLYFRRGVDGSAVGRVGWISGSNVNFEIANDSGSGNILFQTNSAERMRLDSSGNLGLGVTPSAWASGRPAIEASGFSLQSYSANYLALGQNEYVNSSLQYIYKTSAAASLYTQISGAHAWYNAASGTAGNAITFTQAMTLDSAGWLGLGSGAASPAAPLHVSNSQNEIMRLQSSDNVTGNVYLSFYNSASSRKGYIGYGSSADDSLQFYNDANSYMNFATNGTERARITSTGELLVGAAGMGNIYGARLSVEGTSGGSTASEFRVLGSALSTAATYFIKADNNTTTSNVFCKFVINSGGAASGQINANGASAAAFGSWSDERLKENIVDLPPQLSNICALRPVEFDYIESEGGGHQIGFVAQQMEAIYPDVIGEREDGMKSITGWSKTEARLVKAIQELNAKVEAQAAEIAALKGNA